MVISGMTLMNFPITYLFYKLGFPPYTALAVSIGISSITLLTRMYFLKTLLHMKPIVYITKVFLHTFPIAILSAIVPILICWNIKDGVMRFFIIVIVSTIMNISCIWFMGMNAKERIFVKDIVNSRLNKIRNAKLTK